MEYKVYCDESCHLINDNSSVMVLGAVWCPSDEKKRIFQELRDIKIKHGLDSYFEVKWTKVSESKIGFYQEVLDYFWNNPNLYYRGVVARGKEQLNHEQYNEGDSDLWYYKMYFLMLDSIIRHPNEYRIMVDIKDTQGGSRISKLKEVLCNNKYDFECEVVKHIGQINSKESELLQVADLINGAIGYYHRKLQLESGANSGKVNLLKRIQSKQDIDNNTSRNEQKFNLFIWNPRIKGE